jgi:hypothetical protein
VTPGAEHDPNASLLQEMERTHDVVTGFDLMIDVLDARPIGLKQSDRVMHVGDAQERRIADSIGHSRVADAGPEFLVANDVGRAKTDVAEASDSCVAAALITLAEMRRSPDQFYMVAAGILEGNEAVHLPFGGFAGGAAPHGVAQVIERGRGIIQVSRMTQLEGDDLIGGISLKIAKSVGARIGPETNGVATMFGNFKPEIGGCEMRGSVQIPGSEPYITDVLQMDHELLPVFRSSEFRRPAFTSPGTE